FSCKIPTLMATQERSEDRRIPPLTDDVTSAEQGSELIDPATAVFSDTNQISGNGMIVSTEPLIEDHPNEAELIAKLKAKISTNGLTYEESKVLAVLAAEKDDFAATRSLSMDQFTLDRHRKALREKLQPHILGFGLSQIHHIANQHHLNLQT